MFSFTHLFAYPFTKCSIGAALFTVALLLSACSSSEQHPAEGRLPDQVDFNFHIRPILSDRCFTCHGPDQAARVSDLALHTREGLFTALGEDTTQFAIVPGDLARSLVYHRITSQNPNEVMPPPESNLSLSDYEVKLITRWIEQGAEWKPHWAFIPPEAPPVPEVRNTDWPRSPIDRFILDRLEREGIRPSPEADKATLLRRVTFDLTGLPPTVEELEAFLADHAPDAYEKVVDRLLASPAYGERMATVWLDAARYADSHGYQDDFERTMWPWREWVVDAYNENMPYDTFVTWQLAGDLFPEPTYEQILATGFNRNHAINQEAGIIREEFRVEYVADRVATMGTTLLAVTADCARCHDHKYDPLSHKEYFQLFAFFNNLPGTEHEGGRKANGPTITVPEEHLAELREFVAEQVERQKAELEERRNIAPSSYNNWLQQTTGTLPQLPAHLNDGLLAYLPMDFVEDGHADGTAEAGPAQFRVAGEPDVVEGRHGAALEIAAEQAVLLDGIGDFERDQSFSVGAWVYYPAKIRAPLITKVDAQGRGYAVIFNSEQLLVQLVGDASSTIRLISRAALRANEWMHIMVTYDGSSDASGVKVYFNGRSAEEVVQQNDLRGSIRTQAPLVIGYPPATPMPRSRLPVPTDEVRIYDRALNPAEVLALAEHDPLGDLLAVRPDDRSPSQQQSLQAHYLYGYSEPFMQAYRALEHWELRLADLSEEIRVMVMQEAEEPRETYILDRGLYDAPTEQVFPGTPEAILPFPEEYPANRLGLAKWIFDERNPLTARVAVNQYWAMLFGRGIVSTLDDFGNQGALPSHPELLDWLAVTYREIGWDTKEMLKQMVLSATYRQSSVLDPVRVQRDPDNRLFARAARYRLPGEMIRDQALAASGLLVRKMGGPSLRPYQPDGLWEETTSGQGLTRYVTASGEDLYRRSVYTFWKRSVPPPAMLMFDGATREVCSVERQKTNTPLQALVLMNDIQIMEASRVLAERAIREMDGTARERIGRLFETLTLRKPSEQELGILTTYFEAERAGFTADPNRAVQLLNVGEYPADPALPAPEVAAYTMVASTIFNLDETITRE